MTTAFTRERILSDLAEVLDLPADELTEDVSLIDLGLDSVRLMSLVERWRFEGAAIDFVDLASEPQVGAWLEVMGAQ